MKEKDTDPKERKNKKTIFDRINKKSRSKNDNLDLKNGERHKAEKPSESDHGKVSW